MKRPILIIFGILFFTILYSHYEARPKDTNYRPNFFYLGGIQINEKNNEDWVAMLQNAKMNTVEISVYAHQGEWDSDSLSFDDKEDERFIAEMRTAKKAGLKVIFILRLDLDYSFDRNKFIWHGMVMPKTDAMLERWFERYGEFAQRWAKICAQEGVDVFCIGSEMSELSATLPIHKIPSVHQYFGNLNKFKQHEEKAFKHEKKLQSDDLWVCGYKHYKKLKNYVDDRVLAKHQWSQQITFAKEPNRLKMINQRREKCNQYWRKIIRNVQQDFKGKISYAANFDNYMEVGFWDELDFIGINAYFSLRSPDTEIANHQELYNELKSGWLMAFDQIDAFRVRHQWQQKPLLFTELGYINRENSTIEPWAGFGFSVVGNDEKLVVWGKEKENLLERKLAIDALYDVVKEYHINLEGLLYWKLTTHDYHLPYEPFALHLTPDAKDSLQVSLGRFAEF